MSAYDSTVAVPLSLQISWPFCWLQAGVACGIRQAGEKGLPDALRRATGAPTWRTPKSNHQCGGRCKVKGQGC